MNYIIEYQDENEFKKLERSLKKYNMIAYKTLLFEYYPKIKEGQFIGDIVNKDKELGIEEYELKLPTDKLFIKVHGELKLHYTVNKKEGVVTLISFSPKNVLAEGHKRELTTHKGVLVTSDKDIFKINLLKMLSDKDKD